MSILVGLCFIALRFWLNVFSNGFISFRDKLRLALTFFCLLIIVFQPLMGRFHPFTQCFHPFTLPFQPLAWRKTTIFSRRTSNFYAKNHKDDFTFKFIHSWAVIIHSRNIFIHSRDLFNQSCNFFIHSLGERQQSYRECNQQ